MGKESGGVKMDAIRLNPDHGTGYKEVHRNFRMTRRNHLRVL
jgi:hypothetical protein